MTVTSSGAGPEDGAGKLELRNPDGVSEAAIEDGLNLYHRIMACEDPKLKGALESAMQVLYTVLQQYSCYTALLGVVPGLLSRRRPLCRNFNFVYTCVFHERSRGDGQRSNRSTPACRVDSLSKCTRVSNRTYQWIYVAAAVIDPWFRSVFLQVLRDSLRLYGPDQLIGSYNGGKDAVVIMHLHRYDICCW